MLAITKKTSKTSTFFSAIGRGLSTALEVTALAVQIREISKIERFLGEQGWIRSGMSGNTQTWSNGITTLEIKLTK